MNMRIWIFLLSVAAVAQHDDPSPGMKLYSKLCSGCHGESAKGGRGPDLTSGSWRWGGSEQELIRNIVKGIPGTGMPGFPMPDGDARSIIAHLRSLVSTAPQETARGDAAEGQRIFFASGQCSQCHMMQGRGGRLGHDLSKIGSRKKFSEIRSSIRQSDHHEMVEISLTSGEIVRGLKKNEDTYSIQIMDTQERLQSYFRKNVRGIEKVKESILPGLTLTEAQMDGLAAFLYKPAKLDAPPEWKPTADFNVTFDRLKNAGKEPQNWLTYWGDLQGTHYSGLKQITPANISSLRTAWTYQFGGSRIETSPIVVDGKMFVTGPGNDAAALDARTGRTFWRYRRAVPENVHSYCTVMTNRGFAVLGDRLFMGTLDTHLVALDAKTGNTIWDVAVDDYKQGFSITHAPLAINGKIIVGVTAGECGLNGFVDAYDAATGRKLWRVWAIAQRGDPARATWAGNSAETGGGPTWMTGTYDAATNTVFWTTGNPSPDYDGSVRMGDNLYTCSVLAIDPDTGTMKWHFQYTPHDTHDWDANETPVLIDAMHQGRMRKMLIMANRNAFFYAIDRETGEFLHGKPFARQTWAKGLDKNGHPIVIPNTDPTPEGNYSCPDANGAANWAAPSYDPVTKWFYVSVREACAIYTSKSKTPVPGQPYTGTGQQEDAAIASPGAIRAIDPATGDVKWNYPTQSGSITSGVLSTAGGVLFAAIADGYMIALDPRTGKELWHYQTGAEIKNSPIAFAVDGKQYLAIANSHALVTFALP